MFSRRIIVWIAIAILVAANWLLGERMPDGFQWATTVALLVIAAVVLVASIFMDKAKGRDLQKEMKEVDEVMRKENLHKEK